MALLATGNWYEVTWSQTNDAAWAALSPPPGIPSPMADMFVNGTTMVIYVTDSGSGSFVYFGGTATGFDDTLLATDVILTGFTFTDTTANNTEWAIDGSSDLWLYDAPAGTLRTFASTDTTNFKTFLP